MRALNVHQGVLQRVTRRRTIFMDNHQTLLVESIYREVAANLVMLGM